MTSALPSTLVLAASLLALEGVALSALGVGYAAAGLLGSPEDRLGTLLGAGLALLAGFVLLLLARAVRRRRGWSRSPVLVLQALALPVGAGLLQGRVLLVGVPVLLVAGSVLGLLATRPARDALSAG